MKKINLDTYNKLQSLIFYKANNDYGMYIVPDCSQLKLSYRKGKLVTNTEYSVPGELKNYHGDNLTKGEKYIWVKGYAAKKKFFAYDICYTRDKKKEKYFESVNISLARSLLHARGFETLPYCLAGRVDGKEIKTPHNKAMARCLIENAKELKIPVASIIIIHQKTRQVVYEKQL